MHWNIGIVGALMHRANYIVSDEKEKEEENDQIKAALTMNDYPAWMLGETKGRDEVNLTSGKRRFPVKIPRPVRTGLDLQHLHVLQAF